MHDYFYPGERIRVDRGAETGTTGFVLYEYAHPKGSRVVITTVAGFELECPADALVRDI